jgi:hypothetical protein
MDRDYLAIPEAYMRMAFGGMLGPWALVRRDGAASMCFCPDLASRQSGYNVYTGASGLGYYHYLRGTGSYVLPNRAQGVYTFGCRFESDESGMTVEPWDGVGRRIVLRQIGVDLELGFGSFVRLKLDHRRRWFEADVHNPSDKEVDAWLRAKGLWGTGLEVDGRVAVMDKGTAQCPIRLQASRTVRLAGKVTP